MRLRFGLLIHGLDKHLNLTTKIARILKQQS